MKKWFPVAWAFLFFTLFPQDTLLSARALDAGRIVKLINDCRKDRGITPLRVDPRLRESSRLKVREMTERGYFGHTSPAGESFVLNFQRVRYTYGRVGEILARGCESERSVIDLWLKSAPHRQAMLSPDFRDVGCSIVPTRRDGPYIVCHLGRAER